MEEEDKYIYYVLSCSEPGVGVRYGWGSRSGFLHDMYSKIRGMDPCMDIGSGIQLNKI